MSQGTDRDGQEEGWKLAPEDLAGPQRLSDVTDRRLKAMMTREPRVFAPWLKLLLMVAALVGILVFHSQVSEKAAGCYQQVSQPEVVKPAEPAPVPPSAPSPIGNEVQVQIRKQPPAPAP